MISAAVENRKGALELEGLLKDIRESTFGRIDTIEIFEQGNKHAGTKAVFRGLDGGRKVILTVIKKPGNHVAERIVGAGYGLENEVNVAREFGVDEAIENHLAVNYESIRTGNNELVAISPEIDAVCLADYVEKNKFGLNEFRNFFRQVISTQKFMKDKGIYHRDLSPYNLLVKKNGKLEAWTTDLGSACKIEKAKVETLQTRGARTVRDPRVFFKKNAEYGDSQEVYAIAQDMFVALNGKPAVKYDSKDIKRFNSQVHDAAIKSSIQNLPKWARKRYGKLIYKAIASDGNYTIEEFQKDFEKASRLGLLERIKEETSAKIAAAGLAGIIALSSFGSLGIHNLNKNNQTKLETAVTEASKYIVTSKFNNSELELVNNLIDLELNITDKESHKYLCEKDKKPEFLSLKPSQKLDIFPYPRERPIPNNFGLAFPFFKGRVYIEGYPATEFSTQSIFYDTSAYDDVGGPLLPWIDFEVPKEIPEGNYTFVMELYSHDKPDSPNHRSALENIKYEEPGKAISRKRIPVVIGNPRDKIHLHSLRLDYSEFIGLINLEKELWKYNPTMLVNKDISQDTVYKISIPEIEFEREVSFKEKYPSDRSFFSLGLPKPSDEIEKTLQIVARQDGKVVGYTFFPIRGKKIGEGVIWWEASPPDPNFSDRLIEYRKQIYSDSHN